MNLTKTLREWGNVYAVPLSKKEAKALGVQPGDEVDVEVKPHGKGLDLSDLPMLPLGAHAIDLNRLAEDEAAREAMGGR